MPRAVRPCASQVGHGFRSGLAYPLLTSAETKMPSKRESVRVPGRLQGMGQDVACTVFAEKVSLPGTDLYEYDRSFICGAPRDLPVGTYTLTFCGQAMSVQRHNGAWVFSVAT
jgi:hypothetical protein